MDGTDGAAGGYGKVRAGFAGFKVLPPGRRRSKDSGGAPFQFLPNG